MCCKKIITNARRHAIPTHTQSFPGKKNTREFIKSKVKRIKRRKKIPLKRKGNLLLKCSGPQFVR